MNRLTSNVIVTVQLRKCTWYWHYIRRRCCGLRCWKFGIRRYRFSLFSLVNLRRKAMETCQLLIWFWSLHENVIMLYDQSDSLTVRPSRCRLCDVFWLRRSCVSYWIGTVEKSTLSIWLDAFNLMLADFAGGVCDRNCSLDTVQMREELKSTSCCH